MKFQSNIRLGLALAAGLGLSLALRAASPAAAPDQPTAKQLMDKSDCFTCHSFDAKIVGPAYNDVAKRYAKVPDDVIIPKLVKKVKDGGSGNWGSIPMAPHPNLTDAQLTKIVRYVLGRDEKPAAAKPAKDKDKTKAKAKDSKGASKHHGKKAGSEGSAKSQTGTAGD